MNLTEVKKRVEEGLVRVVFHPFIQKGNEGKLTNNEVLRWIMCAGRESRTFPEILNNMISWEKNSEVIKVLQENLDDECGNGNPEHAHFKHYLDLIEKMGLTREDFLNYNEKDGIKLATSLAYNISKSENSGMTIGYMLINEAITPVSYSSVRSSSTVLYPDLNTDFFDIHIEVDEHHVNDLYKAIEQLDQNELADILYGIEIGERGMTVLLDEALGIYDFCSEIPEFSTSLFKK